MKTIRQSLFITVALVVVFFCGMYFAQSRQTILTSHTPIPRVYLEQLKTKINIRREGNVDIYLDSKKIQDDVVLDVKK